MKKNNNIGVRCKQTKLVKKTGDELIYNLTRINSELKRKPISNNRYKQ